MSKIPQDMAQRLFGLSNEMHCVANLDAYFVHVNQALCRTLGYDESTLLARPFTDFILPEDLEETIKVMGVLKEGGEVVHFTNRYRRADSSICYMTWMAACSPEDGLFFATARDSTLEHQFLEQLREQAELLDLATEAIIVTDLERRITYWNRGAETQFGYTAAEVVGRNVCELLAVPERPAYADVDVVAQNGCQRDVDYRRKDGQVIHVASRVVVRRDAHGQAIGLLEVSRDITARKRLREELRLSMREAQSAARLKSEFLSNLGHEIRTPLNAIMGLADLLLSTSVTAEQSEWLHLIVGSGQELLTTLGGVLELSKLATGEISPRPEPADLRANLGALIRSLAATATARGLTLTMNLDQSMPPLVWVDAPRLAQMLRLLVQNALKFTESGGVQVDVTTLALSSELLTLRLQVVDSGPGLCPDLRDLIVPFAQADATLSRRHGGLGIGLATIRYLAELLGSRLDYSTPPEGKGSCFTVDLTLPVVPLEAPLLSQT